METTIERPVHQRQIFGANAEFRENFDRKPFLLEHGLTETHPLFGLPRLHRLAHFLRENDCGIVWDAGEVEIGQRWNEIPKSGKSLDEALEHIDRAGAWIVLKQVERDPEYRELLENFMAEVSELTGRDVKREQKQMDAIIFITSPRRITTYHIDRQCNFLLQVSGKKQINVFDREDRQVLPEQEIEAFWSVDNNAARYRPEYQSRAMQLELQPGNGVHIPVNCPHWLQNGSDVSISFSVSYQFKDTRRKYLYQSNYYLRKLGLNPAPPGQSKFNDRLKCRIMQAAVSTRNIFGSGHAV